MRTSRHSETASAIADLELVDHHCHGVSSAPLNNEDFASLLTEGGREMLSAIDPIASPLGMAVRSLCAPLLDLDPHIPITEYLRRRSSLGEPAVARRMLAGAGLSDLIIDTGHLSDQVLSPDGMKKAGDFETHEIVRIEAVAEEVFASVGGEGFVDEFAPRLASRARERWGSNRSSPTGPVSTSTPTGRLRNPSRGRWPDGLPAAAWRTSSCYVTACGSAWEWQRTLESPSSFTVASVIGTSNCGVRTRLVSRPGSGGSLGR